MKLLTALLTAILVTLAPLSAGAATAAPVVVSPLNDTQIAWTELGDREGKPVVLIMGLGASHRLWGEKIPQGLADEGLRVVLFDNRDVGQSQRYDEYGDPVIWWNFLKVKLGFKPWTVYTLDDMADDVVALLDHLEIEDAHVVGASMGGMIAQTVAINHPERTRSLVSIMSSTGAPHLPPPSDEAGKALGDVAESEGEALQKVHDIGLYPEAMPRQLMAILDSGDRSSRLAELQTPTLVIHGQKDTLLPIEHGRHTAEIIPEADLVEIPAMAHDFPEEVLDQLVGLIAGHVAAN